MATRPCGGPDFGRLPPFYPGERFALQFGPGTPALNWTGATATLTLDSPNGTRTTLTIPSDGAIDTGGASLTFEKSASWSASTFTTPGDWEWHFWVTPGGGQRDHVAWGILPVVIPAGGGLS